MNDGKEVKRWVIPNRKDDFGFSIAVEKNGFTDEQGYGGYTEVMPVADHDRIVAELWVEVEKAQSIAWDRKCKAREHELTIATQSRVIEIAKRVLQNAGLRPPDGGTPTVETICEDLSDAMTEIAAIERGES